MATSEKACRRAVMASQEVILENCEGTRGSVEEVDDDVFAFISEEAQREMGEDISERLSGRKQEQAVESCIDSEFADEWADSVVGEDANRQARSAARRHICESLFS